MDETKLFKTSGWWWEEVSETQVDDTQVQGVKREREVIIKAGKA